MEILNQDERQKLIDLLCQLPGIESYLTYVHSQLVVGLPDDLRKNIISIGAPIPNITNIVDAVTHDAWAKARLFNDSYPILVVIKNAINMVRGGSPLETELQNLMRKLSERLGVSPKETPNLEPPQSSDRFLQQLNIFFDDQLPILKNELNTLYNIFGHHINKRNCDTAYFHLTRICAPVRKFLAILEQGQSNDSKVKAPALLFKSTLLGFIEQEEEVEEHIKHFCDEHGRKIREKQPIDARGAIQRQLAALVYCDESVLKAAEELYDKLNR